MKKITVLAGGVGGARFTQGLLAELARTHPSRDQPVTGAAPTTSVSVTVIANTGDDLWLNGVRVCPDLDTIMYTLAGVVAEHGWGRRDESHRTSAEIARYERGWQWFTLGDLDLATHIVRADLLRSGSTLSQATAHLARRWQLGAQLLPMSDESVETHVRLAEPVDEHVIGDLIHFQEWWVRYKARIRASEFVQVGLDSAAAAPGVLPAIRDADVVIIPPSNPIVSVETILAIPGVREELRATPARVVGISPLIGGRAIRGMADQCLTTVGTETSALAVGLRYGARPAGGVLDAWLVDEIDADALAPLEDAGILASAAPLWMRDVASTAAIASRALNLAHPPS